MTNKQKLLAKVRSGSQNIAFEDMVSLNASIWGSTGSRRSHQFFVHPEVAESLNLQNSSKGKAKLCQVQQFLEDF
jgi:hypothetical protein